MDDLPDSAVIPVTFVGVLASVLPDGLVDDVNPEVRRSRRSEVGFDFRYGRRMRSPVEGVAARRWLHVAIRTLEEKGTHAVRDAVTPDGFLALEEELVPDGEATPCPWCGDYVARPGMGRHQASNIVCRWRRAVAEVSDAWEAGWRDPFNVDAAPLTWAELRSRVRWTRRLLTVPYPRWTAVLLKDGERTEDPVPRRPSATVTPGSGWHDRSVPTSPNMGKE